MAERKKHNRLGSLSTICKPSTMKAFSFVSLKVKPVKEETLQDIHYNQEAGEAVMASSHTDMEANLRCSICLDIFNDPVVLGCSHSFCKACLDRDWNYKLVKQCPLCRQITNRPPLKNLALKDVCESVVEEKRRRISDQIQGVLCAVHGLKQELFCMDDRKLMCFECVSEDHKQHNFCSISKAAEEHRNNLQNALQELESKLPTLTSTKASFAAIATKLQSQGQQTETQIKEEFKKLHQFLREEEAARLSALRDEQKRKNEGITEKIAEVERLQTVLSEKIQNVKEDLRRDESFFLRNFRDTEERDKFTLPDLKLDSGSVIDVAEHMGNLRYRVWEKLKHLCPYYPVIPDPNTKTANLEVSPDLTSITYSPRNSPEKRFCHILGSEGFSSGVHSWQVDVEACEHWALGVVTESTKRSQKLSSCPFLISCNNGKNSWTPIITKIKKVCVSLDLEKKQVVFSDPDTNLTLISYRCESTENMYPCFSPLSPNPMKILPSVSRLV